MSPIRRLTPFFPALLCAAALAAPSNDPRPPSNETASPPARLVLVRDSTLIARYNIDETRVVQAFERALLAYTGQPDRRSAWASLVQPGQHIAIKINTQGGPLLSPPQELINAIVEGLSSAGIDPGHIVVWDKLLQQMVAAGYVPMQPDSQWICQSTIDGAGWNAQAFYFHEIAGQLIWGDHEFKMEAGPEIDPEKLPAQVSNRSHFSNIVTRAEKIIHISSLVDHERIGVMGALASLALGSIDNHRRFLSPSPAAARAIPEILKHDALRDKTLFHLSYGLIAQYAGGPAFNPNFAASPGTLMLSNDPVAIDALAREWFEAWRLEKNVVPIGDLAAHIEAAAAAGLGTTDRQRLQFTELRP